MVNANIVNRLANAKGGTVVIYNDLDFRKIVMIFDVSST